MQALDDVDRRSLVIDVMECPVGNRNVLLERAVDERARMVEGSVLNHSSQISDRLAADAFVDHLLKGRADLSARLVGALLGRLERPRCGTPP